MVQFLILLWCFLPPGIQHKKPSIENAFLGTWHGTSLCVDRNTDIACKDEEVIYVVKDIPSVRDTVAMEAFKIISGQRVSMGMLPLAYSHSSHAWSCELATRARAVWIYQVNDSTLNGTLAELPSMRLMRKVVANRIKE